MNTKPLVSVVIPTYNRAATVEKAVRSVLEQSYSKLELIVIDDGSSDATEELLAAVEDSRLRYIYQTNAGACAARNHGAELAEGEYIAFHDSDDIWYPEKLEKQIRALERSGADIVVCKLLMRRPGGTAAVYPKRIREGFISPTDDLFGIGAQTILARRAVLETTRFDRGLPRYQDLEWIYRALKRYRVYCLDEPLVDYFVGADSISSDPKKLYPALRMLADKYPELRRKSPQLAMHIVRNLMGDLGALRAMSKGEAGAYLRLMSRYYPGLLRYLRSRLQAGERK